MSSENVFVLPATRDRLWWLCERHFTREVFPEWGVTAEEREVLLRRLRPHWEMVYNPETFSVSLLLPGAASADERSKITEAVRDHTNSILAGWRDSMVVAIAVLARVEFSLLRSRAGKPPPFGSEWDSR